MRYSFVNASLAVRQMFTINPTTGVITNLRPLNQAAADFYTVRTLIPKIIMATLSQLDNGEQSYMYHKIEMPKKIHIMNTCT